MNSTPPTAAGTAKPLTRERWQAIRPLFDQIAAQPPEQREAALAASGVDAQALADLRVLLQHHDQATGNFLKSPAAAPAQPVQPATRAGQRLGPWEIVRAVGSGGMGEVFEARRADGRYDGQAAVKLLKRGMDSAAVLQRFSGEQQALARLNHPHIARLLDAGASDEGLPYFVLEFVDGRAIDEVCRNLPLKARLDLFLQLADAVAHAHRNLLVHRDLKPSNVLVNGDGQVKLLDFGIAKALDPLEDQDRNTTVNGARPYTPNYASPEQLRGEPVSTATDIYSLGVLLYQLITGIRPTGRRATTAAQAVRSALEDEPTRPSRLPPGEALDPQWPQTRRRLEGDLDHIVLKALEKDIDRRYSSVEALAADLRAHAAGQPVSAHAASATYLLAKFVRRNRWAVLAAALGGLGLATGLAAALVAERVSLAVGAVALVGGLGMALFQARKAALARDQSQARLDDLRQLVRAVLFDYHDLIEPLPGATPVRKRLVEDALTYLNKMSAAEPADRAARRELGTAYRVIGFVQRNGFRRPHLGDTPGALRSYGRAIALLGALVDQDPKDAQSAYELALALSAKAGVLGEDRDLAGARPLLEHAATLFTQHMAHDTPDHRHRLELARTHLRLAGALLIHGDLPGTQKSIALAREVLQSLAARAPDHVELPHVWVWVHNTASAVYRSLGDWAGDMREQIQSRDIMLRLLAREPGNARFLEDLGSIAHMLLNSAGLQGDAPAVRRWGQEACERLGAMTRHDPDDRVMRTTYLDALIASGAELARVGQGAEALERLTAVEPTVSQALQRWHDEVGIRARQVVLVCAWAAALQAAGQEAAAQERLREAEGLVAGLRSAFAGSPDWLDSTALFVAFIRARLLAEGVLLRGQSSRRDVAIEATKAVVAERDALIARNALVATYFARSTREAPFLLGRLQAPP